MRIADLINNYAQQKTGNVQYYPVSPNDSEIHAARHGKLERREVSKIEDGVRCPRYSRRSETFFGWGRMSQGITNEVRKQAE